MIAAGDLKHPARIRKFALLDVLDPSAVHAQGHLVLSFTGDRAGVTPDALAVINDESVFHQDSCREPGV